jgi:hypothetical protein
MPCSGECEWEWDGTQFNQIGQNCSAGCVCEDPNRLQVTATQVGTRIKTRCVSPTPPSPNDP